MIRNILYCLWFLFIPISALSNSLSEFTYPQGKIVVFSGESKLALYSTTIPDWHTYWKNSGDSGAAPILEFQDNNFKVTKQHWSFPKRISVEGITNFGYENESLLLLETDLPASDRHRGELNLEVLVCKIECIPYFATLKIPEASQENEIDQLISRFQLPSNDLKSIQLSKVSHEKSEMQLRLQSEDLNFLEFDEIQIFPIDGEVFTSASPEVSLEEQDLLFKMRTTEAPTSKNSQHAFLFGLFKKGQLINSFEIETSKSETKSQPYLVILLFAFLGGIVLNLMPCVFPVLSLKALSLIRQKESSQNAHKEGWAYTAGVCLTFFGLGMILLLLRLAGEEVGWGFQMQNPWTVAALAVLFFWIAMNLFGFFEVDINLQVSSKNKSSLQGSFWSGVLATLVATPCTAPFMGTALGASLALSPILSLGIFVAIGFGMAFPFLLIGYFPKAISILPKPGAWMETFKNFLAFPMLATILWLLWVLSLQSGSEAVLAILGIFIFVAATISLKRFIKKERIQRFFLAFCFCISILLVYWMPQAQPQSSQTTQAWKDFDQQSINTDLSGGKSVFIDFTAAWCLTCQVNKKTVLRTAEVENFFMENNISLYVADWTNKDLVITQELVKYGRNSLPLYVFLENQQKDPILLPEILTKEMIFKLKKQTEEK